MKKNILFLFLGLLLIISMSVNAVYFPDEITDEMINDWIEEAKKYKSDSSLQMEDTNHAVTKISSSGGKLVTFETGARKIMEKAHEEHRKYIEPSIKELSKIIDRNPKLLVTQTLLVDNRTYRDTEAMHLVFKITSDNEEKIIQPKELIFEDEGYQDEIHIGMKKYEFDYKKFPSHQEYINGDYDISAIFISYFGEDELNVPWDEIR